MNKLVLIRDVTKDECPWLNEDLKKGKIVYNYHGATYGCITFRGVAVSEKDNVLPFFEIPRDAIWE